jgi:hypothetical protein
VAGDGGRLCRRARNEAGFGTHVVALLPQDGLEFRMTTFIRGFSLR